MALSQYDLVYAKFLAEAREEDGNFFFVKALDPELYEKLCKVERNAILNLNDSGMELRNALEIFMRHAMPQAYVSEVLSENARRTRRKPSGRADIVDYQAVFQHHPELSVDTRCFRTIRLAGNAFHHEDEEQRRDLPTRTYQTLCDALVSFHKMLGAYYRTQGKMTGEVAEYCVDRQPYGDRLVCAVINTLDSTACEKQVLCSSESGRLAGQKRYYLLRVYRAASASEGAVRDEKVLSTLWESSLRDPPNIVRYAPLHVEYHGEDPKNEKKYIIAYDFGPFKPVPLHGRLIRTLSDQQKLVLMRDIATGVKALHAAGLYHRNLQPGSVFVFSKPDSEEIQAKLVGFEYTKIDGDSATVFANVAKRQEEDPSAFFSRTMKAGLSNKKIGSQLDWAKEDVYSMGALFYFIWMGKTPPADVSRNDFAKISWGELAELIGSMMALRVTERPDAAIVAARLETL